MKRKILSTFFAITLLSSLTSFNVIANQTISVYLDNQPLQFDVAPQMINGRTMVPFRAIFEALGASVDWNQETKTVTSVLGDKTVKLTIDSNIMYVNDTEIELDVAAEIINDRTLVPVRAVSEAFECDVNWEDASKTVIIEKQVAAVICCNKKMD